MRDKPYVKKGHACKDRLYIFTPARPILPVDYRCSHKAEKHTETLSAVIKLFWHVRSQNQRPVPTQVLTMHSPNTTLYRSTSWARQPERLIAKRISSATNGCHLWGRPSRLSCSAARKQTATGLGVDVIVVGAGIVGLSTAATLLKRDPSVSVAVVDRAAPCAGATGAGVHTRLVLIEWLEVSQFHNFRAYSHNISHNCASGHNSSCRKNPPHTISAGQGYIWMAHRDPGSFAWKLAATSRQLWQQLIPRLYSGGSPNSTFGNTVQWQVVHTDTHGRYVFRIS